MSVDTTAASSALSGITSATTGSSKLGENDFLKLLVTQLSHQDPLSPMDDQAFVAQLAQFSSLEQLTNINAGVAELNTTTAAGQMVSAVSFIGKEVTAAGDTLAKSGTSVSKLSYTLPDTASQVTVNVMDSNGNIVRSTKLGAEAAGAQTYQWDGKDSNGNVVADGQYTVGLSAVKADGTAETVSTSVSGLVSGVSNKNGAIVFTTKDGRTLNFSDVQGIVDPTTTSSTDTSS